MVAGGQDETDVETACLELDLAAGQPADLAVLAVRAEPCVDVAELLDDLVEDDRFDERRADVDADGRAHDRLDPAQCRRPDRDHPTPAWSSAAWSDCV